MSKLERFAPGTIILTPFPFSDLSGSKLRPAVILVDESPNSILVAFISSQKDSAKNKYVITIPLGECAELKARSYIRYGKLANIHKGIVVGSLGKLPKKTYDRLRAKVAKMFV